MVKGDFVFFTWYQQSPFLANPHGCQLREGICSYVLPQHMKIPSGEFSTRLYRQFNSFPGVFFFRTLNNLLLKLADLHSQPSAPSHMFLKRRLWSWTDEAEPAFTACKQQLLFSPTLPIASTCTPCLMDTTTVPTKLPCCFSHYQETVENTVQRRMTEEKHQC